MDIVLYFLAIALVLWAQVKVKGKYSHFSTVPTIARRSGYEVARQILDLKGLHDVEVKQSQFGVLSDHYDPKTNTVNLSPKVYAQSTIASVAIAAHEVGHAIQYAERYQFIAVRSTLLPIAVISGHLGWIVAIMGLFLSFTNMFYLGIIMLSMVALFQLITLPIEYDASARALNILSSDGFINLDETADAKSMLNAAALTYVAAFVATLLQILRLLVLANRRRD